MTPPRRIKQGAIDSKRRSTSFSADPQGSQPLPVVLPETSKIVSVPIQNTIRSSSNHPKAANRRKRKRTTPYDLLAAKVRVKLAARAISVEVRTVETLAETMVNAIPETSGNVTRAAQAIGPCYDSHTLWSWLGISKQAVEKRRKTHKLIGIQDNQGRWAYPAWQFVPGTNTTIPGLTNVLTELSKGTSDSWSWALWLVGQVPDTLDGKPAWQWLAEGNSIDPVVDFARADATAWAAP